MCLCVVCTKVAVPLLRASFEYSTHVGNILPTDDGNFPVALVLIRLFCYLFLQLLVVVGISSQCVFYHENSIHFSSSRRFLLLSVCLSNAVDFPFSFHCNLRTFCFAWLSYLIKMFQLYAHFHHIIKAGQTHFGGCLLTTRTANIEELNRRKQKRKVVQ